MCQLTTEVDTVVHEPYGNCHADIKYLIHKKCEK